ncbi:lysine-rich nucleolar protein 1-like [Watersipora subatra]|uniref:lysine-rich nucleolar protein 1-like n=1 Tax=Watersipora subatra TaxID=2589382 RepID=UPI00355BDB4E
MEELNLSENETELVPRDTAAMDDAEAKKREKKNKRRNRKLATESENEAKSVQPAAVTMGQWSTADLGNSDRQNKFFKLMGGFGASHKTNLSNSNASPKPFAAKFNAALDKKRESQLQNRLEQQFDQARFTSLNAKGLGLGFTQPKKNSIDISAVRSKRFDD